MEKNMETERERRERERERRKEVYMYVICISKRNIKGGKQLSGKHGDVQETLKVRKRNKYIEKTCETSTEILIELRETELTEAKTHMITDGKTTITNTKVNAQNDCAHALCFRLETQERRNYHYANRFSGIQRRICQNSLGQF